MKEYLDLFVDVFIGGALWVIILFIVFVFLIFFGWIGYNLGRKNYNYDILQEKSAKIIRFRRKDKY